VKMLFLGGARSGKSRLALQAAVALAGPGQRIFVATAQALDGEMAKRISAHRAARDKSWRTVEEPLAIRPVIEAGLPEEVLLVDCLTLWLSNLLAARPQEAEAEIKKLAEAVGRSPRHLVLVANEVGLGIVPDNPLARRFRDLAGWLNQEVAEVVDEVFLVVAGQSLRLK